MIVPKQSDEIFSQYIEHVFAKHNTKVEFINTTELHNWGGEAYFATNVIRNCELR